MSDFKFTDNTPESEPTPDLAQHSEFHFTDKEIEEQVQAEKQRRQAELDAEMSKPAQPKPAADDEFTFIDTPLSLSGEPRPPKPARPNVTAAGGTVQAEDTPLKPAAAAPPAAAAGATAPQTGGPRLQAPNVAGAKAPSAARPAAKPAAPISSPKIPGPQVPSPQAGRAVRPPAPAAKTATGQAAGAAAGKSTVAAKDMAVSPDVAANLKHSLDATTATVDPIYREEEQPAWRTLLDKFDPLFNGILILAALGGALALAYILWGIFSGGIGQLPDDPARAAEITRNITTATKVLTYCLFCASIAGVVLLLDETWLGATIAGIGIAMHFGAVPALGGIGQTQPVLVLIQGSRSIGFALLVIGLLKCTVDIGRWLIDLPNRARLRANVGTATRAEAAQQRIAANANMFSPCWQLPFCREVIRKQCPAYIARKRCWKFGRGCYCDEEMISRIVRGESEEAVAAPTRMSRQGKPPCGRCYIFLEHQNLKYKVISPMAVPVTIIGMFMVWSPMMAAMTVAGHGLQGLWARLSFSAATLTTATGPEAIDAYKLSADEVQRVAMSMFGVIFGFFALIYISKFIEWAIYKARW